MINMNELHHKGLDAVAHEKDRRHVHWFGRRGGSHRRMYICNLCGMVMDTESAQDRPTKHAFKSIKEHREIHIKEVGEIGE